MTDLPSPPRWGVPPAHPSARIQAVVQQALDDRRLVGADVLVACDGELFHRRAAGFADRESTRPMTVVAFTSTRYEGMSGRFVTDLRDAAYGALEVQ